MNNNYTCNTPKHDSAETLTELTVDGSTAQYVCHTTKKIHSVQHTKCGHFVATIKMKRNAKESMCVTFIDIDSNCKNSLSYITHILHELEQKSDIKPNPKLQETFLSKLLQPSTIDHTDCCAVRVKVRVDVKVVIWVRTRVRVTKV